MIRIRKQVWVEENNICKVALNWGGQLLVTLADQGVYYVDKPYVEGFCRKKGLPYEEIKELLALKRKRTFEGTNERV